MYYDEDLWSTSEDKVKVGAKLLLKTLNSNFINDGGKTLEGVGGDSEVSGVIAVKLSKSKVANFVKLTLHSEI